MKRAKALLLLVVTAVLLSACDFDVYELPLPGGPDVGDNPMTIKVQFADVLDLVPQSTVKVNDVSVGQVTAIDLDGYHAVVTIGDATRRRAARQRRGRDPPDQPARREVRLARGSGAGRERRPPRERRRRSRSSAPVATRRSRRCSAR